MVDAQCNTILICKPYFSVFIPTTSSGHTTTANRYNYNSEIWLGILDQTVHCYHSYSAGINQENHCNNGTHMATTVMEIYWPLKSTKLTISLHYIST